MKTFTYLINNVTEVKHYNKQISVKLDNGYIYLFPEEYKHKILSDVFLSVHYKNRLILALFDDNEIYNQIDKVIENPSFFLKIRLKFILYKLELYVHKIQSGRKVQEEYSNNI